MLPISQMRRLRDQGGNVPCRPPEQAEGTLLDAFVYRAVPERASPRGPPLVPESARRPARHGADGSGGGRLAPLGGGIPELVLSREAGRAEAER